MNASYGVPTSVVMTNIIMARRFAEFREMRLEFKTDMARQVWDETRHALMMMRALLNEMGCDFGDYTYSDKVWLKHIVGDGLAEKLAIEQVFQEGNALQANIPFCESLNEGGVDDFAEMLDYVDADDAAAKIGAQLKPKAPLQARLREMAYYPHGFIEMMAKTT